MTVIMRMLTLRFALLRDLPGAAAVRLVPPEGCLTNPPTALYCTRTRPSPVRLHVTQKFEVDLRIHATLSTTC